MLGLLVTAALGATASLPAPILVNEQSISLPVSSAVRSETIKDLPAPLPGPLSLTFHCTMDMTDGRPLDCVEGERPSSWKAFDSKVIQTALRENGPEADPVRKVAAARIGLTRVHLVPGNNTVRETVMTFVETVAPDDAIPDPVPVPTAPLTWQDVTFETGIDQAMLASLYPRTALRRGVHARAELTCRITVPRRLFCYRGVIKDADNEAVPLGDWISKQFKLASYQVASTMRLAPRTKGDIDVVGQDIVINVNWGGR